MLETRLITFQNGIQINLAVMDGTTAVVQSVMGGLFGGVDFGIRDRNKLIRLAREHFGAIGEVISEIYCYTDDNVGFTAYYNPVGDEMTNMRVIYRNRVVYNSVIDIPFTNLRAMQAEAQKIITIVR